MTEDEIDDLAYGMVEDKLDEGIEFLDAVEAVADNYEGASDEDARAVFEAANTYMLELKRKF